MHRLLPCLAMLGACVAASDSGSGSAPGSTDWPAVGNDRGGMRYSELAQIQRGNVHELEVAWTYSTGELERGGRTIECTPLVLGGVMFLTTAHLRVIALDAATGEELWVFDPFAPAPGEERAWRKLDYPLASGGVNRGLACWSDGLPGGERRLFHGSAEGRLYSLDARTGKLDPKFGDGGVVELRAGIARNLKRMPYGPTSAPSIFDDLVILGFSTGEGPDPAAPGDVRAFDVHSGNERWRFHTVPRPGELGNDSWAGDSWQDRGGTNAWGGLSVDEKRGWVFFGLGSATFDFYGGDRLGSNLFANSVVALDARTGKRQWHYQTVHHDLWDHDLPTYPNLVEITKDGKTIEAAAQVTKAGFVFVFDRETGTPLFEVREVEVAASNVPGEEAWPTQPIPVAPPPFAQQTVTEADLTELSPEAHAAALEQYRTLRAGPAYMPPSEGGTLVVPGFHGGATWAGASYDPTTNLLFVNSNNQPNVLTLEKAPADARYEYRITGYNKFVDAEGFPAVKPPWGLLTAIDLASGEHAWQVVLGEYPELTARGVPPTGTHNFGGTIATAGGLVFIGGTADERFHAFDSATGELLWEAQLPAGGYATPCTYSVDGRQFVAIAAGGAGKVGTKAGDQFVVFALPESTP